MTARAALDDAEDAVWEAFDGRPHALRMGLRALDPGRWTVPWPAASLTREFDRKAELLARDRAAVLNVAAEADGVAGAAHEFSRALVDHLVRHHAERYVRHADDLTLVDDGRSWDLSGMDPLELVGRIVTEDWCLVRPGRSSGDAPVFAAGAVYSPNRWQLSDKIGQSVRDVHHPVPGYAGRLGTPVDAVLARNSSWWRRNWSIVASPQRFQPESLGPATPSVPDGVWVRSEYETLVRLPSCGWWVFGIHTSVRPLRAIAHHPDVALRVLTAVGSLDNHTAAYKSLATWHEPLLVWLRAAAQAPGSASSTMSA